MKTKQELINLIERGSLENKNHNILNEEAEQVISKIIDISKNNPKLLFESLLEAKLNTHLVTYITPILLALLISYSDPLKWKNEEQFLDLLSRFDASLMLEFSLYFKNRWFGAGLGSSLQKAIKKAVENWSDSILEMHLVNQRKESYSLFKIVHPKFKGNKAKLVKEKLFNFD